MDQENKWYDLRAANALFRYAEPRFRFETDRKVFRALQSLESQQDGLCKDVVSSFRAIARCAKIDFTSVKLVLKRLESYGLIKLTIGSKNYADRIATRVRRYSVEELKKNELESSPAKRLERVLNKRPIQYGKKTVQPTYNKAATNRLYSSKPNVQGSKAVRAEHLAMNCKPGQELLELDFIAAEPTIISKAIGYDKDGYTVIAEAEGMERGAVKKIFNPIVYARTSAVKAAYAHGIESKEALAYFAAVDRFRESLRYPQGKAVRQITTLTGTVIEAPQGKKVHKGTLLAYYAQGTIADFINEASLKIIELEKVRGWKFVAPCHDSVFVAVGTENRQHLKEVFNDERAPKQTTAQTPNPRE